MNADTAPTAAAEPRATGQPPVRATNTAAAEAITRMRSEHVLSAPLTEEWVRRCTGELTPERDAVDVVEVRVCLAGVVPGLGIGDGDLGAEFLELLRGGEGG